jgi:hypothetical protein
MFGSILASAALLPLFGAGLLCALRSITSWVAAVRLLVWTTLFGGIIFIHLGSGAILVVFRDLFIVLPLYVAFLSGSAARQAFARIPADLALMLIVVVAYLGLSTLNTTAGSLMQVVIGLKIWLFYLPFLVIGLALAARPEAMFSVFRTILLWGAVACCIGLLQSFLVRVIGYQSTMTFFFGSKAADVTQHFAWFQDAGGIFRIPGTFTFATQYTNFLYLFLAVAAVEANADPDPRLRRYGQFAMFLAAFALLLSGSRATGLTVSAFFAGYFFFGLLRLGHLSLAPVAAIGGWAALQGIGFDPAGLFSTGSRLVGFYSRTFVFQSIGDALRYGPFGAGIGTSTNAARYAVAGLTAQLNLGYESYLAKVAAELGSIGLGVVGGFFVIVFVRITTELMKSRFRPANAIVAPFALYLLFNILTFFKGSPLDQDPGNIFFWLVLGVVIGISRMAVLQGDSIVAGAIPRPPILAEIGPAGPQPIGRHVPG